MPHTTAKSGGLVHGIKNLHIFYNLLNEICVVMQTKRHEHLEFTDKHWISCRFGISGWYLWAHVKSEFAVAGQAAGHIVSSLWKHITAFKTKLKLWEQQVREKKTIPNFTLC